MAFGWRVDDLGSSLTQNSASGSNHTLVVLDSPLREICPSVHFLSLAVSNLRSTQPGTLAVVFLKVDGLDLCWVPRHSPKYEDCHRCSRFSGITMQRYSIVEAVWQTPREKYVAKC